ncbi:Tat pathway signal protein [Paenibacillus sp. alder61]|uniref:Tat pathway signal protein n=1 Tax=Paenibacillus faecis TaxID=862114 RepID=A0A5D0CSZ2_9BACL|nr:MULTISPECIES: Tat pathway signal protein [Paenibacillus]MCA1293670.1 Tat pathway signal protein [Paenibacillus sp. alder61]TYA12780.1 Tat pathway signal protein [Paenibacillus faecis]
MRGVATIYCIARADLRERTRHFSFLATLGLAMMAAYFCVPPADAGYVTVHLGGVYRGVYNSAWVGASVAISSLFFLSLFGFYLVKNSIQRDERTRVGEIIASAPVKKLYYLTGKAMSNFAVLSIIATAVMGVSAVMQWSRGEVRRIEVWDLVSPFLFMVLPILSVVAVLAVLFETWKLLRGGLGNAVYFVLFILFATMIDSFPFGVSVFTSDMMRELREIDPAFSDNYGIGILFPHAPIQRFEYQGVAWTGHLILQQLIPLAVAAAFLLIAALLFRGFKEPVRAGAIEMASEEISGADCEAVRSEPAAVRAAELTSVPVVGAFWPLLAGELRLLRKGASLGWLIVTLLLSLLCLFLPTEVSRTWLIWPLVWIWPLTMWSGIGSREARYHTESMALSSPYFATRQLLAVWLSGVLATLFAGGGMLIRLMLEKDIAHLIYAGSAVLLIPSLSLVCGVLTRTNRTFEVLYMLIWYLGPFNKTPYLDFLGGTPTDWTAVQAGGIYILLSLGMTGTAYLARSGLKNHF